MFNKNNTYLHVSPSLGHHLAGGAEFFLHHNHDENYNYLPAAAPVVLDGVAATALFNTTELGGGGIMMNGENYLPPATGARKQTAQVKRDRHSKIQTSQGPRDRRVRLSIGIARKFFDLQEMLGFDKPSKTLDWLLTKSRAAIKDLVQKKKKTSTNTTTTRPETFGADEDDEEIQENGNCKSSSDYKRRSNLAKESRVKARARARERTREKMCMKLQLNDGNAGLDLDPSPHVDSGSGRRVQGPVLHYCPSSYEPAHDEQNLIQEPNIVIKRRPKNPSILGFHQPNLIISRDFVSSNCSNPFPYSAPENWDISGFTSQSAIFDHHRFVNSNISNYDN